MKLNSYLAFLAVIGSLLTVSCNQSKKDEAAGKPVLSTADSSMVIMVRAAQSGVVNLLQCQIAIDSAVTPELKTFGSYLKNQQQIVVDDIKKIAGTRNITISDSISSIQKLRIRRFRVDGTDEEKRLLLRIITEFRLQKKALQFLTSISDKEVSSFAANNVMVVTAAVDSIRDFRTEVYPDDRDATAKRAK